MEKAHFHVWTRFRVFQGENVVNRKILGGGDWGGSEALSLTSRNDALQLWAWSQVQGHGAECSWFTPYWFSWADHFHFIDFLGWLACVFLLVRGHFAPFRFIFGFLLLPLVSVCCSNHDCQLLTKYDISSSDSFSVWRKIANEKLNLQRSLGLAQPSWESCCHG